MKSPIPYTYDLNTKSAQKVICVTHTDDNSVDVIQLHVVQNGALIDFSGNTIIARMVMSRTHELLSDNVVCEIDEATKDVMIPIDRKAVSTRKGLMLVEVSVRGVLPQKLTFQFPLLVRVNGSILDDAEITPESQGTIPELLKGAADALEEATQALEQAGDYDSLEHKPQINGNTLSGNKTSDELGLQNKLTAGENVNIDANGNITITGVTKYRNVPTEQVDDCIENGVLYSLYISGLQSNAQIIAHNNYTTITQHALLDDGRLMYRMRQGETPWQPAGEWSAWEEIGGDYNSLSNKPQINSHTLSGNKSSDDLGLQKKLTAGTNITIANDGTISASGGVTSYNDLTDKPKYNINYDGTFTNKDIIGIIKLLQPFFQDENGITLKNITNQSLQDYTQYFYGFYSRTITYNFGTTLNHVFIRCGCFSTTVNSCSNIPSAFSPYLPSNDLFYIIHLFTTHGAYNSQLARMVIFEDNTNHKIRVFAQLIGCERSNPEATITAITDWVELTGGSQIVSGVVNQNGTITFTDSEGQTVTTAGNNIVTSGNQQISTGYDSGGFYFLFDDGQEAS